MFCSDDPRGVANYLWLWWFPGFDALAVALALPVAFLLARRRRPVPLLRLPLRPLPRRLPAMPAAIALARLPGTKALLAPFEQTIPHARSAWQPSPPPSLLIFGMTC